MSKKEKNKKKIIVTIILFLIVLIITGIVTYKINAYEYKVKFNLKGEKNITLIYPEQYQEEGYKAISCSLTHCRNIESEVKIISNVDYNKIGTYNIEYKLDYNTKHYSDSRLINIVETEPPKIELKGNKEVTICPNSKYQEEGYTAIDNYDGDITDKVTINKTDNIITYEVKDTSNNIATDTRKINYLDNIPPVISLKGSTTLTLTSGSAYQEPGYIATDSCDGDITSKVTVSGTVDTNTIGNYTLTYTVTDSKGNKSTAYRKVNIYNFNTSDIDSYISSLETYIKTNNYNVSIGYVNLNTGYTYTYRENQVFYGASLVKTVDALYAYENLELTDEIKSLVSKAISVSDNPSHKTLVSIIGKDNLRSYGQSLGASHFLVEPTDTYGNTTVNDQIAIWKYLYNFTNNDSRGNELKDYFINSFCNKLIYPGSPTIMHKYGLHKQYYHDVGIVFDNSPYIVVILTKEGNNNYSNIVSDLSQKINNFNKLTQ